MSFYVYLIRNAVNGKCYIGQTIKSPDRRINEHFQGRRRSAIALAIKKHGAMNFTRHVLQVCDSQSEMDDAEVEWIQRLGTVAPGGYNIALGGKGQGAVSEEIRAKIARSKSGIARPDWVREKISNSASANVGEKSSNRKLTLEEVKFIRQCARDKSMTGRQLASQLGVTEANISAIIRNKSWIDPNYNPLI